VFNEMGNLSNAAYFLNKAVSIYRKADPSNPGLAKAYVFTGDLYTNKKDFPAAQAYYDSALHIVWPGYTPSVTDPANLETMPSEELLLTALTGKGNAYFEDAESRGDAPAFQKALDAFSLASGVIEKLDEVTSNAESKMMLNKRAYEINQKGISAALKLYNIKNDPNYAESAFLFSEHNKARIMAESINKSEIRKFAGIPDSLLNMERDLRSELTLYQKKQKEAEELNNIKAMTT
jgi:tetratricopeptide (TPR) repeat protein